MVYLLMCVCLYLCIILWVYAIWGVYAVLWCRGSGGGDDDEMGLLRRLWVVMVPCGVWFISIISGV